MADRDLLRERDNSPVVFVFLDPWTVHTGRGGDMVRAMLANGFRLLDFELRRLTEADAEEIYRFNHPIREENSWHVARLVYPMGQSLGLLLGVDEADACACRRMRSLKGRANPSLGRPGQLRHDFKAPNRCLSLMHSSDDIDQVRREGRVFFSVERIESACAKAVAGEPPPTSAAADLEYVLDDVGLERVVEPNIATLFARVRLRLIRTLQGSCASSLAQCRAAIADLEQLWKPVSVQSFGARCLHSQPNRKSVMREVGEYLELVAGERHLIEAIVTARWAHGSDALSAAQFYRPHSPDAESILCCLQILSAPAMYARWDSDRQIPREVLYDRWERLLFRTYLFNFDDYLRLEPEVRS